MKRCWLMAAVGAIALCACGRSIPPPTIDVETTPRLIEQEADPVDLTSIIAGGPLYVYQEKSANPTLKAYRRLRAQRVAEMLDMLKEERARLKETLREMPRFRSETLRFLGRLEEKLDPRNPVHAKLKTYVLDTIDKAVEAGTKTTLLYANLDALAEQLDDANDLPGSTRPMLEYTAYALYGSLIDAIRFELSYIPARCAGFVEIVKGNAKMYGWRTRRIAKKFDRRMGGVIENVQEPFEEAIAIYLDVSVGFQSLEAADYAFVRASLEYAQAAASRIEEHVGKVKVGDDISQESASFYKTYATFIKAYVDSASEQFSGVKAPRYLAMVEPRDGLIPAFLVGTAHAGVKDWISKTAGSLTQSIKGAGKAVYGSATGCVTSPWQCTKTAFKNTQKGIGMAVDSVNLAVGTGMDVAAGVYYGNSMKDIQDNVGKNMTQIFTTWDEGHPGSTVLKDAKGYLDAAEKGMGAAAQSITKSVIGSVEKGLSKATGGYIKNVWGKEGMSWAAGKLGEVTTNMVTGFGKGVVTLANPKSTKAELLEGAIDVAFSFTGGSKSVVKGSQAMRGMKEMGEQLAKKGATEMEKLSMRMSAGALRKSSNKILTTAAKKLNAAEIQMLYSNAKGIVAYEATETFIKNTEKKMGKILGEALEKSGKAVWGNMKGVPDAIKGFTKQSFKNSAGGYMNAAKSIFGTSMTEYADNVMGNLLDTQLKEWFIPMVAPADEKKIATAEANAAPFAGIDMSTHPELAKALTRMVAVAAEATKEFSAVQQAAEAKAEAIATAAVEGKIAEEVKKATDDVEDELSKPVSASGSFSGDYSGSVSMTLTPLGGPVSGSVTTRYGAASINGSVSKNGTLHASVSGIFQYERYDGKMKKCTLSASMSGSVSAHGASGSYSGSCAKEGDSGRWSVRW